MQQVIAWANVDPDLSGHMAPLGQNELRTHKISMAILNDLTSETFSLIKFQLKNYFNQYVTQHQCTSLQIHQ